MINLLPGSAKKDIQFARRNTTMTKWVFAFICAIALLWLTAFSGLIYLQQSTANYSKQIEQGQQSLKDQKYEETKAELESMSGTIKLAVQVLSREILFSKLLQQLGNTIPPNTALVGLTINNLEGGITLQAGADDIESATQLQLNLQDPKNKIFEKADIDSIACKDKLDDKQGYLCTVQIKALFASDNPFQFITKPTANGATP